MARFPCSTGQYDVSGLVPAVPLTTTGSGNPASFTGGSVSASGYYTGQYPAYAFCQTSGGAASGSWGTDYGLTHWLKVSFDVATEIKALVYICKSGGGTIKFQYSDNDSTWSDTDWSITNPSFMDSSIGIINNGAHKYWRFLCTSETRFTPGIKCILYK